MLATGAGVKLAGMAAGPVGRRVVAQPVKSNPDTRPAIKLSRSRGEFVFITKVESRDTLHALAGDRDDSRGHESLRREIEQLLSANPGTLADINNIARLQPEVGL